MCNRNPSSARHLLRADKREGNKRRRKAQDLLLFAAQGVELGAGAFQCGLHTIQLVLQALCLAPEGRGLVPEGILALRGGRSSRGREK